MSIKPVDKYGRKWPEIDTWPRMAWLCPECKQLDLRSNCNHKKMPKDKVLKLGGELA